MTILSNVKSIALNGGVYGSIEGKRGLRQGDPISPLIFVICMEYFSRIMKQVATMQGFEFHTKCKGLKLNHLCFADDVLLFCKGELPSILLMLRGLATFSEASGLKTNEAKSNIYSANMNEHDLGDLCEITGYKRGTMPFRYLGVPISAKKISSMDCEMLVDKICARIKSWGSSNLSYARRVMLINSVLLHIHTYWSSIFILPKKITKNITTICRNFLWDGRTNTNRVPLIAWELICRPNIEGGLGIIDCETWNQAAIAKKKDWWQYKPPQDCSWYWRKICSIKDQFAEGFDQQKWLANNGKYTVKNGYTWKQGTKERWASSRWIWSRNNIPKHSFIYWLAMHKRLQTRERLAKLGICKETQCAICEAGIETTEHLFFDCDYSRTCLSEILKWLQVGVQQYKIEGLWRRMTRNSRGKLTETSPVLS
ncbi:PREDICTED: uncharacterized protein LOC109213459 [Nicotiana attenuata]|uniref:uncharacterized protein LOC109213459 n=1 Tax=Nicotiana attenuata TaxID=49451 RepID=UPI00090576FD|nr:PREDICTED: uncharacterized protein LOC109213459 [Nicotiana attenuata]